MSEMQRNKGIIKRLSTKENTKEVFDKLVADDLLDTKWCDFDDETGIPTYISDDRYELVNGTIFDVSGAPDSTDDYEDINEAERLNDTDYRVHAYFYNGGAGFGEMLDESIPRADKDSEWKSADGVKVRMVLSKHDDSSVKYTYEGDFNWLLRDDDGGFYGYEQAQCDAAEAIDGDHMKYEDWHVESVEYKAA